MGLSAIEWTDLTDNIIDVAQTTVYW